LIGLGVRKTQNLGHRRAGFRLGGLPALKISMGSGASKDQDRSLGWGGAIREDPVLTGLTVLMRWDF